MKAKRINQLIEASGLQGFDFANDSVEVNWTVALHDDKMLARRTLTTDYNEEVECFAVPYAFFEDADELYEEIVVDFVETCFGVMANGSAADLGLFRDYAGANDYDLLELLAFFGRDYADFLSDVFFWYSVYQETDALLADYEDQAGEQISMFSEEERIAQKVIWHLADMELSVEMNDGVVYWEFAVARERIWFHRVDIEIDDDYFSVDPSFGSIDSADECAFEALCDAVMADVNDDSALSFEVDKEVLDLFDLGLVEE